VRITGSFLVSHPAHFIALGFGAGLIPKAPGTWGTLVALPIFAVAHMLGGAGVVLITSIVLFGVGIWASDITGKHLGVADHGGIVIDEIAAFLFVLSLTPPTFAWIAFAFVLFRLFDIVKPWPIRVADKKIKGGFGVMFDDLLAAIMAIAVLLVTNSLIVGAAK
jgi:phosphatidylglycerophosphatase A